MFALFCLAILKIFCALCLGPFWMFFFFLGTFAACHAAHLYANACVYWHSLTVATPLYAIYVLFSVPFMSTSFFWFIGPTVFHIAAHFTFRPFAPFAGQQMFAVLLVNLKCIKWATHHRKRCRVAVFHSRICSVFRSVFLSPTGHTKCWTVRISFGPILQNLFAEPFVFFFFLTCLWQLNFNKGESFNTAARKS